MALSHDQYARLKEELLAPGGPNTNPSEPWTDDHFALMDKLEGFSLADCILQAAIRGQERLARTLMERRGPVPIVFGSDPRVSCCYNLNGESFGLSVDETVFAANATSPAALKSLLAMIDEFGMRGLIEPGRSYPFLLKKVETNSFLMKNNVSRFDGVLPELVDGVLGQPELAIALNHESKHTSTPDAYKPMLCWASEDMVLQFQINLAPLVHYQEVEGHGSMAQWKAASGQSGNLDFSNIVVGVAPSKACSKLVDYLHQTMAPMSSRLGFRDEHGRLLCETTADFLLQFPAKYCREDNLTSAFDFAANYCPIDIMAAQADVTCREKFGVVETRRVMPTTYRTKMVSSFDLLFKALKNDNPLQKRVMDLMTSEQWLSLFQKASSADPHSMIGLYQAFGIDNTGKSTLSHPQLLDVLANGGYRFSSQTKVFTDGAKFSKHNQSKDLGIVPSIRLPFDESSFSPVSGASQLTRDIFANCLKLNIWPAGGAAPADIAQALKMSARVSFEVLSTPKALALHTYLVNAGVEACRKAATTSSHWMTLTEVFSNEDLEPYLQVMPSKARGRVLELGLGL